MKSEIIGYISGERTIFEALTFLDKHEGQIVVAAAEMYLEYEKDEDLETAEFDWYKDYLKDRKIYQKMDEFILELKNTGKYNQ